MHPDIASFLEKCSRTPAAITPVRAAWRAFNDSLPTGRRGSWSRDRFLGALIGEASLSVGELEGRAVIVGLSVPGTGWTVADGQVKLAESAA
jgi:hypothetical protein